MRQLTDSVIYNSSISGHATFNNSDGVPKEISHSSEPRIEYELEVYERDVKLTRHALNFKSKSGRSRGGVRNIIHQLSWKSMNNFRFTARNLQGLTHSIVVSYPADFPWDGSVVKKHLFALRKFLVRQGVGGVWMKEFQSRGALHVHYLVNGSVDRELLRCRWSEIVGSCDPEHDRHGTLIEPIRDIERVVSYISKWNSKTVPDGYETVGRFWGVFGGVKPKAKLRICGTADDIIPVFSECLSHENERREHDGFRPREYSGVYSFTSFGSSDILKHTVEMTGKRGVRARTYLRYARMVALGRIRIMMTLYMIRNRLFWLRWRCLLLPH